MVHADGYDLRQHWQEGRSRDVNSDMGHRVPDPTGPDTETIFYLRVAPVPDPNRDGYGTGIFFSLVGN
jgi:hypothetical protein